MVLSMLPSKAQSLDSNKLLLIYCAVCSLSLLRYQFTKQERQNITEFIYLHYVPNGEGFRGSMTHKLSDWNRYDPGTLANTYSALCILTTLGDDLAGVEKDKIMKYVKDCQIVNGSFLSILDINGHPFGDGDLRQCYLASSIRRLLNYKGDHDFNILKMIKFIKSQCTYDGGLGAGESHAGLTFCGLSALQLVGALDRDEWSNTAHWLVHRQLFYTEYNRDLLEYKFCDEVDQGSHNGRENKFGDTCYSFWVIGALSLLRSSQFVNKQHCENYLLNVTQNRIIGGFSKTDSDDPDPYHSFLAIAALSIMKFEGIGELDYELVVPKLATNKL
ncbi:hypothetical protein WICMUC_002285 [Wickerhamomyces mucosus]|uniref:Prenyltransferase alpha-alpha toroid domain-containing protein n=1 Tax=Wickerhamomyces mucosus TaxID=1378264 RepID=A0A9P8PRH4_9ASCO|nr:hypothetical protein WICMUC_002285 [Wickerhamomyces mucosus]